MSSSIGFSSWNLDKDIYAAIEKRGWTEPTSIQLEAIPIARKGLDIVGQARTGSGKTAAFGIPLLEKCSNIKSIQALVLCPTRELAVQVAEEMNTLQGDKGLNIQTVYGGVDLDKQAKKLAEGAQIIVGTPGRVIDMTKRGHINLEQVQMFCLDEADRMLDMGFFPDVLWVFEKMINRKQTLLFSATFPQEILDAAEEFMGEAVHVMSDDLEVEVPEIEQFAIQIGRINKMWALGRIISNLEEEEQMLVFANTKRMVDIIVERLERSRIKSVGLHGDIAQNKREKILDSFREGEFRIVIATDVAARGLDVDGITHVVNYDLPDDSESYVHRIGRTGRMGRKGESWSFVTREDTPLLNKIASTWNMKIPFVEVPKLSKNTDRDPIKMREDWNEVTDAFGMIKVRLEIGKKIVTKNSLFEWVLKTTKVPELAIGEITIDNDNSVMEIHVEKISYVIGVLKSKKFEDNALNPKVC
ncbi:MAG: DEAD/DEAH box helicase [Candidatus Thalassarchaeaceae archaeon]|nr:DEAD/DEAH box helicase [Candidatus Thalassarchaeaceae archaeon]